MLRYFIDIRTREETKDLFKGLKIEDEKDIMKLQGEYPIIFITFKNEKYMSCEDFKDGITFLLFSVYKEHEYLLKSDKLSLIDKQEYLAMMEKKVSIQKNMRSRLTKKVAMKVRIFKRVP